VAFDLLVVYSMLLGCVCVVSIFVDAASDDLPRTSGALRRLGFSPDRSLSGQWLYLAFILAVAIVAGWHGYI